MQNDMTNHHCRIVLTGGPGGGKTTAADLMRREVGERIVIVPEAATMLFSGGFPRHEEIHDNAMASAGGEASGAQQELRSRGIERVEFPRLSATLIMPESSPGHRE